MLRALLLWPERHPGRILLLVTLLFVGAYSASLFLLPKPTSRLVVGDALHYYVYLRSAVFDRDLHFENDYRGLVTGMRGGEDGPIVREETTTNTGHLRNVMSVGPAILWAPMFLLATAAVWAARVVGIEYPLDGFAPLFQVTPFYSGIAAAAAGVWLTFRLLERWFGRRIAIWSALTMWLASSAIYYSLVSPAYSHAATMLAASAFFYVWGTTLTDTSVRRYAAVGAMGGLCALMRWQDVVFLVAPVAEIALLVGRRRIAADTGLSRLAVCGATAVAAFVPQIVAWLIIFGQPIALPQGSGFMRWTSPHLVDVLFSDFHGLFSWTPITLVAVTGLVFVSRGATTDGRRALALGTVAAFVASWYVNAAVVDWWAGEAFGARRFVSCFPILSVGLAAALQRWPGRLVPLASIAVTFVVLNVLLLLQYQAFMHGLDELSPYPRGIYGLWIARFIVPIRLLEWVLSGSGA